MEKAGGERGSHLLVSLPLLFCPTRAPPPLLSSSVSCLWSLGCCGSRAGWGGAEWGRDAVGIKGRGGPRVTVADPPSLTVRTPSPRPLHLRTNSRMSEESFKQYTFYLKS